MNDDQADFQTRVDIWAVQCFGHEIAHDKQVRNYRFLEEALELVQSCGCTKLEATQLVDYVYGRPAGETQQEVGGVMITLTTLCNAHDIDVVAESENELMRIWSLIDKIRQKSLNKPKFGPLPL